VDDDFIFGEEEGNEDFSDADIGDLFWDCEYCLYIVIKIAQLSHTLLSYHIAAHMDRVSNHGSPGRMEDNRSWQSAGGNNFKCTPPQEVEEVSFASNSLNFTYN